MYDKGVVLDLLQSVVAATKRITKKMQHIQTATDFILNETNRDALDVLCMQLTAIGEGIKQIDKQTQGKLFDKYSQVDWKGLKGIRDVIAHQYFDISLEAVFDTCRKDIPVLQEILEMILKDISAR
jgi:uncharacterized protein with HEPN domain